MSKIYICLIGIIFLFASCNEGQTTIVPQEISPEPSPEISWEDRCNKFKNNAYSKLHDGTILLVFDDTIKNSTRDYVFGETVNRYFKKRVGNRSFTLDHRPIFDTLFYPKCILPIMDSAIATVYGANTKDSIIDLAYRMTDSIYNVKEKTKKW